MKETCNQLLQFLRSAGMTKSVKALLEDMENINNNENPEKTSNNNLLKIIQNVIQNTNNKQQQKNSQVQKKENRPNFINKVENKQTKLFNQEETEQIMEKLMNKLVSSSKLLEDEKLNAKIEKFFDNQTFQKMVEATDVMQDISNMSFTNSFLQKNKQDAQSLIKTEENINSYLEDHQVPQIPDFGQNQNQFVNQNQQIIQSIQQNNLNFQKSNQTDQKQKIQIQNQLSQQYTDELFQTEEDQGNKPQKNNIQINQSDQMNNEKQQLQQINLIESGKMPSIIKTDNYNDTSDYSQYQILDNLEDQKQFIDEYTDDDDPGFDLYEVPEKEFLRVAQQLAEKYDFPKRACANIPKKEGHDYHQDYPRTIQTNSNQEDSQILIKDLQKPNQIKDEEKKQLDVKKNKKASIYLPEHIKFPQTKDEFYPVQYDKVIYDVFNLKVIFDRERTGFEETKDFPIVINSIIAGRYQVMEYLGSAAFSKAIQCLDLVTNKVMCMKIIENNKDYFDQSIDEIKLLRFINCNGNVDEKNVLKYYDYFYHKEHLFIVTELLKDNLYEFYKFNKENEATPYFTIGRLQKIAYQILVGLEYIHSLCLIHCDLKPENILMKSYSKAEVKIIDFGSSCFIHDHLSSYVQSRSYRAPEVIIGCKYDYRIDMWSLGCILSELYNGQVLFQNDNIQGMLARIIGIIGPFPEWMMKEGKLVHNLFTREKLIYMEVNDEGDTSQKMGESSEIINKQKQKSGKIQIFVPKKTNLKSRLKIDDNLFLDFLRQLLQLDYTRRPTAKEAMSHLWFQKGRYQDGL